MKGGISKLMFLFDEYKSGFIKPFYRMELSIMLNTQLLWELQKQQ